MTDTTTTTQATAPETTPAVSESAEVTEAPQETGTGREAAKYRHQLREAEGARDVLSGQLASARRALVDNVLTAGIDIGGKSLRPTVNGDVFEFGKVDVATLFGEDGALDRDALAEAARGLHATRPQLFESAARWNVGNHVPKEGSVPRVSGGTTWASAIRAGRQD